MSNASQNLVFIDTGLFLGLLDKEDDHHLGAKKLWAKFEHSKQNLVTSNFVLDESFTLIRSRLGIRILTAFRQTLHESFSIISIERVTVDDESNSWRWFLRDWPKLSYTDCTSFALMNRLGLTRVGSFDRHFTMAGFQLEKL